MGAFPLCTHITEVSFVLAVVDKNEHSEGAELSLLSNFVCINS